jgi:hypothetical protein
MDRENEIKWAATLSHVREVSLLGTADLAFWADLLKDEGLVPRAENGKAQIMILGAQAKFSGLPFREISISLQAHTPHAQAKADEVFLLAAFNSNRFFAFCERFFFSTPYAHACIHLGSSPPSLQIAKDDAIPFSAKQFDSATQNPTQQSDGQWRGRVHLPKIKRESVRQRFFFAHLAGQTTRFSFLPSDSLTINPLAPGDVFSTLIASHFTPHEWIIRPDATHAKSKTYRRDDPAFT